MRGKFAIRGMLIDGIKDEPATSGLVLVEDGIITYAGEEGIKKIDRDTQVIEGKAIMPGMIDCHVHLCGGGETEYLTRTIRSTLEVTTLKGYAYAKRTLDAGFTTIRDVGSPAYMGVSLRDVIRDGFLPGPRIVACGPPLSMTGGHGQLLPPWVSLQHTTFAVFADGIDEVKKEVRRQVGFHVDFIKITTTGGVLDPVSEPGQTNYNYDEIKTIVDEAHKLHRKVASHCEGLEGAQFNAKAGVDTMEHGMRLDEEICAMMRQKGLFLVPTLVTPYNLMLHGTKAGIPQYVIDKAMEIGKIHIASFRLAYESGVKIAMGTDSAMPFCYHGDNAKELELMTQYCMTPMDAIISTTRIAAEALDLEKKTGTLEEGKFADLIVVDGDPVNDIKVLQDKSKIKLVMKEGRIEKLLDQ